MGRRQRALLAAVLATAAASVVASEDTSPAPANGTEADEVRTTPQPYKWVPDRPPPEEISCLKELPLGCVSAQDEGTCLGSRDGGSVAQEQGLNISGEPCIWCGGAMCHTGTANTCVPFDYLVHGKSAGAFKDYRDDATYTVAACAGATESISEESSLCLKWQPLGCSLIDGKDECLSSRDGSAVREMDGLKVGGQPCVWCGGPCTSKDSSVCAPYDWVVHGQGKAFQTFVAQAVYRVASCKAGEHSDVRNWWVPAEVKPPVVELTTPAPYWRGKRPSELEMGCLQYAATGCSLIQDADVCLRSRDGRNETTHNAGLQLYGEPCVWCGGGICTSKNKDLCEPWNYLMFGETVDRAFPREFDTFHARGYYTVAKCMDGAPIPPAQRRWGGERPSFEPPPPPAPRYLQCLHEHAAGCDAITDMGLCLDSVDGRQQVKDSHGLQIFGQPCVWCGGGPCVTDSTSLCQPFDYLMRGGGVAFHAFLATTTFTVATCKARPDSTPLVQQTEELMCLTSDTSGCSSIRDEQQCLASRDGSEADFFAGLRIRDQACVWCGGLACTTSSNSTCEPYDYAVNGAGRAFLAANTRATWKVGNCQGAQPGVAFVPPAPLTVLATTTLRASWDPLAPVVAVNYGQCGGTFWDGPTKCGEGMVCKMKTSAFWQCVPGEASDATAPHPGEDCLPACGKGGECEWCGPNAACCRGDGWLGDPPECQGVVAPTKATWFHQCGALPTGGAGGGAGAAGAGPSAGRFVAAESGDRGIYWQDPRGKRKYPVSDSAACDACGCRGNVVLLPQEELDGLKTGKPFRCSFLTDGVGGSRSADTPEASATDGAAAVLSGNASANETAAGAADVRAGKSWFPTVPLGILGVLLLCGLAVLMWAIGICSPPKEEEGRSKKRSAGSRTRALEDFGDGNAEVEAPLVAAAAGAVGGVPQAASASSIAGSFSTSGFAPASLRGVQVRGAAPNQSFQAVASLPPHVVWQQPGVSGRPVGPYAAVPAEPSTLHYRTVTFTGQGADLQSKAQAYMGVHPGAGAVAAEGAHPMAVFDAIDRNHDGEITREEWQRYAFEAFDQNRDGVVSEDEWRRGRQGQ